MLKWSPTETNSLPSSNWKKRPLGDTRSVPLSPGTAVPVVNDAPFEIAP